MMQGGLTEFGGAPIILLQDQESKKRLKGYEAHKANILACKQVADTIRSSFGPKGMDKIIVSPDGDITITNDGATILKKMPVNHEIARLLVELSQSQDDEVGDGTTGVVIIAGALLKEALHLLDMKLHPLKIADGYEQACQIANQRIQEISTKLDDETQRLEILKQAATTALCSKVVSSQSELLADICVKAVMAVADADRKDVNFDLIKVEGKAGGKLEETALIEGIALDKDFSHSQMKKEVEDAKIAILTCPFEPPKPKAKHKLSIKDSGAYKELLEQEQKYFRDMVQMVKSSGANVVICQWGFDDEANHLLLTNELPAIRWVGGQEIELISLATGGQIVPRFEDLTPEKLGRAKSVKEISVGTEDDKMVFIEGCPKGRAVTILVRGGNEMVISEAKRCIHDALCVVRNLICDPQVVAGGGASEVAASLAVLEASRNLGTVEAHALEAFADALMSVPEALAENSGLNPIEVSSNLKAEQLATQNPHLGLDCNSGVCADMLQRRVLESLGSKTHQLALATQVVKMILKIDDIIVPDDEV
eukprot:Blabericola_migrator_1__3879@NODE_216_length_11289_cov_52_870166_g183_i0_p2_GENE_NODE_216_length_11289_cov_52_870166_g183_i0NODE_216_length_11289_cov_52_870166_g183_i0_p2_ORF_typecomplete_len539_score155_42Cpn60_TCP1/PF00118_24/1_2e171_NODE_216_length_11289_cov_52_870166_g183_i0846010076